MNDRDAELERKLAAVRRDYLSRLPARLDAVMIQFARARDADEEAMVGLHREIHSLTGSLGTFGFIDLSKLARTIEQRLKSIVSGEAQLTDALAETIHSDLLELQGGIRELETRAAQPPRDEQPTRRQSMYVIVLDTAPGSGKELADKLTAFGYEARCIDEPAALAEVLAQATPEAIVARIRDDEQDAESCIQQIGATLDPESRPPLIIISEGDDLDLRLAAVRAGARGFFPMPVAMNDLAERLDVVTRRSRTVPYRVLIVDDDSDLGTRYALVLRQAGIESRHISDPMALLDAIDEFKPELILLDLYMPDCTGIELATVIRQNNAYLGIPIIFLSSETSSEMQFRALRQGGDGFLTKPIEDEELINSVVARSERIRAVSAHLSRDSLTGLLNHSTIKELASAEFQRAIRNEQILSCVMIDIDHFKHVNDTYGHAVGDQVIATLARMLLQRLRDTDVVGRYGGEEFIVLMPNTNQHAALAVIDDLRARFADFSHPAGAGRFTASFSAGVVESSGHRNAAAMISAADDALYRSKAAGRNRVSLATDAPSPAGQTTA